MPVVFDVVKWVCTCDSVPVCDVRWPSIRLQLEDWDSVVCEFGGSASTCEDLEGSGDSSRSGKPVGKE